MILKKIKIIKIFNKNNKLKFFKKFNSKKNKDYMTMLNNFILCLNNNSIKPICGTEDGLKNIKIVLRANEK